MEIDFYFPTMQSKVSIVVSCYNKVKWIGGMLQSMYDQYWDNIELILVNDGSTDGTREVIAEWEPKLKARGYDVIIIDQENQGVAGAVRNGMLHISGDYFCAIDCDDRLAKEYFTIMAGWLDDNPEYDGVSCAFELDKEYKPDKIYIVNYSAEESNRLENYIFKRMEISACIYLTRTSYIKKCQVIENFHTIPNVSQEPSLIVPLLGNNGKFKYIPKGLYLRNCEASEQGALKTFFKAISLAQGYYELITLSIQKLDISLAKKERLLILTELGKLKAYLNWTAHFNEAEPYRQQWIDEYFSLICKYFHFSFEAICKNVIFANIHIFFNVFEKWLFKEPLNKMPEIPNGRRIIGYGVLGKNAQKSLPFLKGTPYFPTILWDKASADMKPNFEILTDSDILLVFPKSFDILEEVKENVKSKAICVEYDTIIDYLGGILFSDFNFSCQC